ncbi:protein FIZZY-RELATED 2-like [Brachypodium distachyon]|uniref:Uncharacterized protein n=1 Tax=Brachypodium distachyon TaxID=15368 RepID=A0A2K2DHL2_BRADI|nr:protein FIZZY-RELATED 2-like [Brachypodium distachyon]PNT73771.1 hypothetical protein BRADI_1g01174v3 [Brachypodium distachyon]|eukprot:XP_024317974.1 protein FIZZY-RELATED 2-like [Brachypodium distachyon]
MRFGGSAQRGTHRAVGTNQGKVQIWDARESDQWKIIACEWVLLHGALHCFLLAVATRNILHHNIRAPYAYVSKLTGHKSEVCGLKWSYDNRQLASGGSDSGLFVWNQHSDIQYSQY